MCHNNMSVNEKLIVLSDAAKYDVACTSSGTSRKNNGVGLGNATAAGICHSFSSDGRCISLLKILFTNECVFDCKFCINRASNDVPRATFTPDEICNLTMEFYRRNYIEGLFLSSGIIENPDNTMRLLYETVFLLREKYHFGGYIHLKGIPGASSDLIDAAGLYADRMSINLELPTSEGLKTLAPHKSRKTILTPMRHIQNQINNSHNLGLTDSRHNYRPIKDTVLSSTELSLNGTIIKSTSDNLESNNYEQLLENSNHRSLTYGKNIKRPFVPAGQSTQMIIGATPETDFQIVSVADALYKNYDLKRVFYSAFIDINHDSALPVTNLDSPPLLREHRLYQADWLLRFYGFQSHELLSEARPNFNLQLDPKCDWAVRHLELFPVEINTATYYTLLRVPGIGVTSARRIIQARKSSKLSFDQIKKMGVVLKRALYFITCSGKMMYPTKIDESYITSNLAVHDKKDVFEISNPYAYEQLSLFSSTSIVS